MFAAVVIARHADRTTWLHIIFIAALVAITRIDLEHRIIPDRILAPLAVIALVLTAIFEPHQLIERLIAGAAAGGFLLAVVLAYPKGMGMGDVKLAAVMGLVLGRGVAPALLVALVAGTLAGIAIMARHGVVPGPQDGDPVRALPRARGRRRSVAGPTLANAYLHGFGL